MTSSEAGSEPCRSALCAGYMALGLQNSGLPLWSDSDPVRKFLVIDGVIIYAHHADRMFCEVLGSLGALAGETRDRLPPGYWIDEVAEGFGRWFAEQTGAAGELPDYDSCIHWLGKRTVSFFVKGGTAHNDLVEILCSDYPELEILYEWSEDDD
ncbi:MAG: hypothetical protein Q8R44_03735 [Novosphingobium sp.]|nr:hypothetical protein [Novosphingobium sp.]